MRALLKLNRTALLALSVVWMSPSGARAQQSVRPKHVLVLAGDNDPRCPIRQIENYLDRLSQRKLPYEFYRYDAGHGSLVIAETIKQTLIEVYFALRALGLR